MEYKSLSIQHKEQDAREIFAHFPFNEQAGEFWEEPYKKLAHLAKEESWSYQRPEFIKKYQNQSYPILTSYLNYTFLRLQEENKIRLSVDGDEACFNTGLQTQSGKDIYATFVRNKQAEELNQPDWTLYSFVDSNSTKLEPFKPLPDLADYTRGVNDLVFNTEYNIEPDLDDFLTHNQHILPEFLQGDIKIAENIIDRKLLFMKARVRRNYKIAVPHWYEGKVQLLLPLVLTNDEGIADLALVVDRDDKRKIYCGKKILTMDIAYVDARLISKPADDWLNP